MRFVYNFEMVKAFLSKRTNLEAVKLKVNKFHYLKVEFSAQQNFHHQKTNDQPEKHLKHILLTNDEFS